MKTTAGLFAGLTLIAALAAKEVTVSANKPTQPGMAASAAITAAIPTPIDGDEAYKANCSRCHLPPRKFAPKKMATIMMHMRVRANLTAAETDAILKYLTQ
ncbi:MAG: hypothetical protein HYZ57_12235 [Acidobacteria bacterium]|nr:hypothetical protein [Acidobacteriota bacterium]MBI3280599.1 hypothetical protein [Acidobacteriota bacterium]